jgi:hypothetical protein
MSISGTLNEEAWGLEKTAIQNQQIKLSILILNLFALLLKFIFPLHVTMVNIKKSRFISTPPL